MKHLILTALLSFLPFTPSTASAESFSPPEKAPILREVKVIGSIRKYSVVRAGDSIAFSDETVCTFTGKAPLYDLRELGKTFSPTTIASCKSKVGRKSVDVKVSGYLSLSDWLTPGTETRTLSKMANAVLYVKDRRGDNASIADLRGSIGTLDVNQSSMLMFLTSASPGGSIPELGEYFISSLEFQDSGR